ncbi:MAG TPA: hypothetical protein VKZ91_04845 [Woeseiaceae bacterium]|nr:hypothetical protein [Woeseiaceae bacterium]
MSATQEQCFDNSECDPVEEVRLFEAGETDPGSFDHEAHVRVAWSYLHRYPAAIAIARFTSALRSLTTRLGANDKYHETISWFFLIVIAERRAACPNGDWQSFKKVNRDLFDGSALLRRYYSRDRLDSPDARRVFLLPDLAPRERANAAQDRQAVQPGLFGNSPG